MTSTWQMDHHYTTPSHGTFFIEPVYHEPSCPLLKAHCQVVLDIQDDFQIRFERLKAKQANLQQKSDVIFAELDERDKLLLKGIDELGENLDDATRASTILKSSIKDLTRTFGM